MIPRGTTPTICFHYHTVLVEDIDVAYLTIKQRGTTIIEKDLSQAIIADNYLMWRLTQEETLLIEEKATLEIQCRFKTVDGYAGQSRIHKESGRKILKDGVI